MMPFNLGKSDVSRIANRVFSALPDLPQITSEVDIPVYMIHMDGEAEDYFFLFDFELFAQQSTGGLFVRPQLKIWAGRDDFARSDFARHFRQSFQAEFDRMRTDLVGKGKARGWLGFDLGATIAGFATGLLANMVLWLALSAGRSFLGRFKPSWLSKKSEAVKLEGEIKALQEQVDAALKNTEVLLHPELYERVRNLGGPLAATRVKRDAWPLPDFVREHMNDRQSGAWW